MAKIIYFLLILICIQMSFAVPLNDQDSIFERQESQTTEMPALHIGIRKVGTILKNFFSPSKENIDNYMAGNYMAKVTKSQPTTTTVVSVPQAPVQISVSSKPISIVGQQQSTVSSQTESENEIEVEDSDEEPENEDYKK